MDEDWSIDVRKHAPAASAAVIAGVVHYCGIALRSRDSSLVSFSDPAETDRVRENFLKKKLGLTDPDSTLDGAIAAAGERIGGDPARNRVTVYYLLAEHFGKLGLFGSAEAAPAPLPLMAAATAPVAAAIVPAHRKSAGWWPAVPLVLLVLSALGILWLITSKRTAAVAAAPAVVETAAVAISVAEPIPAGAGIITAVVAGKPMVSIYFETAKSDIDASFEARTAELRGHLAAHPDTHLQLSGFNDPRGNAEYNARLSKSRAFAVRDALVKLGVSAAAIDLVKPAATTDTAESLAGARRVDVTVEDGPVPEDAAVPAVGAAPTAS